MNLILICMLKNWVNKSNISIFVSVGNVYVSASIDLETSNQPEYPVRSNVRGICVSYFGPIQSKEKMHVYVYYSYFWAIVEDDQGFWAIVEDDQGSCTPDLNLRACSMIHSDNAHQS